MNAGEKPTPTAKAENRFTIARHAVTKCVNGKS
jgi:hypothetical protein